jgi:hypothetical protein
LNRRISITVIPPKMGGSVAMGGMAPQWCFQILGFLPI